MCQDFLEHPRRATPCIRTESIPQGGRDRGGICPSSRLAEGWAPLFTFVEQFTLLLTSVWDQAAWVGGGSSCDWHLADKVSEVGKGLILDSKSDPGT